MLATGRRILTWFEEKPLWLQTVMYSLGCIPVMLLSWGVAEAMGWGT